MLDLKRRGMMDLHAYIWHLEEWLIRTLARFNIEGFRRVGRVGVWVLNAKGGEAKIAALGIRVRQWVAYHGVALNIDPNLEHFSGIVPCGIKGFGVTSMYEMGQFPSMEEVDMQLRDVFSEVFL
jgi:lipoyl(octanoyl) transferase